MEQASQRHGGLDGLRTIGALLVALSHGVLFVPGGFPASNAVDRVVSIAVGRVGLANMDLFLAVAGFVAAQKIARQGHVEGFLGRYLAGRAVRILPLYVLYLLAATILVPVAFEDPLDARLLASAATLTLNVDIAIRGTWPPPSSVWFLHLWTVGWLEQAGLLLALSLPRISPRRVPLALVGAALASVLTRAALASCGAGDVTLSHLPFTRMEPYVGGALLGWWATTGRLPRVPHLAWLALLALLCIEVSFARATGASLHDFKSSLIFERLLISVLVVFLVWAATAPTGAPRTRAILESPILGVFAPYSYGIYLFQQFTVAFASLHNQPARRHGVAFFTAFHNAETGWLGALMVAIIAHKFIEPPLANVVRRAVRVWWPNAPVVPRREPAP